MINVYDFDKTIYDGDSTIDFYLYCLKKNKKMIFFLPIQIYAMVLYLLKIKDKEYFKEKFFIFLKKLSDVDNDVKDFWKLNQNKIKPWYITQKNKTDVIISASPEFLLKPLKNVLKIDKIIATKVDKKTGAFVGKNCHDKEKVKRYDKECNKKINNFYSDSLSDKPMMMLANKAFLVKGNKIKEISKLEIDKI